MKILGDQIRNNPDRVLSSIPKVNARLETGQFAFPFVSYCYSFSITIMQYNYYALFCMVMHHFTFLTIMHDSALLCINYYYYAV